MSRERISDIEVLRGFAVLVVVAHHSRINLFSWEAPWLESLATYFGGWVDVDLFFAISGFVIARTLLPQLQASQDKRAAPNRPPSHANLHLADASRRYEP